jgi:integrase
VNELRNPGGLREKAGETADRDEANLRNHVLPRWKDKKALEISVGDVERWFESLHKSYSWDTIGKFQGVMSQIYAHAQRNKRIPASNEANPFRSFKVGGVRGKTDPPGTSSKQVVTLEQFFKLLTLLNTEDEKPYWYMALYFAATVLRGVEGFGVRWGNVDFTNGRIELRQGFSKGKVTRGKIQKKMTSVAMHPLLAGFLQEWKQETPYSKDNDWVFASPFTKGLKPYSANTASKDHLKPAAIKVGVIPADYQGKFGWHNLRHSLSTFYGNSGMSLRELMEALRHDKVETAMRYWHAQEESLRHAQGSFLSGIKAESFTTQAATQM